MLLTLCNVLPLLWGSNTCSEAILIQDHICSHLSALYARKKQDLFVGRVARALVKTRTGNVPEVHVVTWSRLHAYAEILYWSRILFWLSSFFSLTHTWAHDGRDCDLWLKVRLQVWAWCPRNNYICGITVLKSLCRWLRLIPSPLLAFRGEPRSETKLVIFGSTIYHGLDSGRRRASFIFRELPVACSESRTVLQATGSWVRALEQGYRCAASDTSFALLTEEWHYFCVAVSSMRQLVIRW